MKRKALCAIGAAALALGVIAPSAASAAGNGPGDCHADLLQGYKTGHTGAEATADAYGVTVRQGQEIISGMCGQS